MFLALYATISACFGVYVRRSELSWTAIDAANIVIDQGIGFVSPSGSTAVQPTATTEYTVIVSNAWGVSRATATVSVLGNVAPQPAGSFGAKYQDLIPQDATVAAYDPKRFSLMTGTVHDRSDQPIAGVSVSIVSHPEYGTGITNDQGKFTQPVDGGGVLTVSYKKSGFLSTHRQVAMPWNDIAIVEKITLIPADSAVTKVMFNGDVSLVTVHQSTVVTDEFGSRSARIVSTGDNMAYAKVGNAEVPLRTLDVRATEFDTPSAMPAALPPNSGFTHCVDISADGVDEVRFAKPIVTYIENFLGFPVGTAVPVGYYDYGKAAWVPSKNGVVVRLLDTDADEKIDGIDINDDGRPDDLNGNGQVSDEAMGLGAATGLVAGATYWRTEISHLTPWDHNWPYGPPLEAKPPQPEGVATVDQPKTKEDESHKTCTNSYVEDLGRVYHEDIPIPGTDVSLHYSSRSGDGIITIPIAGTSVAPPSVKRIEVELQIAGRLFAATVARTVTEPVRFAWDRKDYLGRVVDNTTVGKIRIGYVYDAVYYTPSAWEMSFAQAGGALTGVRARNEVTLWKDSEIKVFGGQTGIVAQGWSIPGHSQLDMTDGATQYDGLGVSSRYARVISTIAGNGTRDYDLARHGDGVSSLGSGIVPNGVDVDAAGNVYFTNSEAWSQGVYRVDAEGVLHKILDGDAGCHFSGDGKLAIPYGTMCDPVGIAIDDKGALYVADSGNSRIRKIDNTGIVRTIAGNGQQTVTGESGSATSLGIGRPQGVTVDSSGNVYFSTSQETNATWPCEGRVFKIDTTGLLTLVAGRGVNPIVNQGTPYYCLEYPEGIAIDRDGNLYIADWGYQLVRKVDKNGVMTTVAGFWDYVRQGGDDGSFATEVQTS